MARASNEGPEGIGRRKGTLRGLRKDRSLPGDIFAAIHKARAEWTRGRWDNALTELQQAKDILRGRVLETPEWATLMNFDDQNR